MTNLRWKLAILVNIRFCFLCYGGLNDNRANSDSGSITSGLIFALDISRDVENLALRTLRSSLRRSITLIAPSSVCIIIAKCCRQRFSKTFDDCLSTFSYPASTPGRLDRIIEKTLPVMFACKENKPRIPEMKKNQKNSDYLILFTNAAEQKEEHRMIEKAVEGRRLRCAVIYINGIEKRERKAQDEFIAYLKKRIASGPELLFQADNFQQLSSVLRMAILAGKNISQNSNSGDSTDGFEEMSSHRNLAKQHTPTMNKNFTRSQ
uniref:VWFA domain-containing protein n=1 Tax=Trichuris muris TaxID=70415 RepID=A0A5S6QI59_TRIMR